jgi:hypothetical protein
MENETQVQEEYVQPSGFDKIVENLRIQHDRIDEKIRYMLG